MNWSEILKLVAIFSALAAGGGSALHDLLKPPAESQQRAQVVTQDVYRALYDLDQRLDRMEIGALP